eukprot:jgi/Phyca11/109005/e_gw1.16.393.1
MEPRHEDDGREVFTSLENEGPLRRKSFLSNSPSASTTKVYPTASEPELHIKSSSLEKKSSKYNKTETQTKPQDGSSIGLALVIGFGVCVCLAWTLWLILLNVAPNDTVNRVMDTESFDYGSFWLMIKPSAALVGVTTAGLSVVALGYLAVLVKLLLSFRHNSKKAYSGSPAPLIGIFTVVVASNALSFDFLIIVGCPMLVLLYCLSTFTFDRAKFAINLEVFPAGWFEQSASVIADPVETAVIYKSLKSLRIMSTLDFFTRMGVNITLCYRLRNVVDLIQGPRQQLSSVYPKKHRLSVGVFVIFAIFLVIFVEESMRTSDVATGSLTQCPCLMLIDRDIAPKMYSEWENPTNVTEKVAQLASTGDLQTLQLTNRYLAVIPDELRLCTNLRHL